MHELIRLGSSALLGVALGAVFFGGLWWTVRHSLRSNAPALWILGSWLLRSGIVLTGVWFSCRGDWRSLLACMLGFWGVRAVSIRSAQRRPGRLPAGVQALR